MSLSIRIPRRTSQMGHACQLSFSPRILSLQEIPPPAPLTPQPRSDARLQPRHRSREAATDCSPGTGAAKRRQIVAQGASPGIESANAEPRRGERNREGSSSNEAAGEIWQRRFYDLNVWTEHKRIEKLRYMHRNPVKRGLVIRPEQWGWSSFRNYAFGEAGPVRINDCQVLELKIQPPAA